MATTSEKIQAAEKLGKENGWILGTDVSHWQGNMAKYYPLLLAKGAKFLIAKGSEGYYIEQNGYKYAKEAKAAGFPYVGAYLFYRESFTNYQGMQVQTTARRMAETFYEATNGGAFDMPPMLDLEFASYQKSINPTKVHDTLLAMESVFGRKPGIYTNPGMIKYHLKNAPWIGNYFKWIAHYEPAPNIDIPPVSISGRMIDIWQYNYYVFEGKNLDHNWFMGDETELKEFCNGKYDAPVPVEKTHAKIISQWLFGRSKPFYTPGYGDVVFSRNQELKLTGESFLDDRPESGILFVEVEVPNCPCCKMWISSGKRWVEMVSRA